MKKLLILSVIALSGCSITENAFVKVGAGYKFQESKYVWRDGGNEKTSNPISARFELGSREGNFSYGLSHHSQWFDGEPFNNDMENYKTEVFVDYEISLGDLWK
tara:strand:- start:317 stop:628 length:312 start_codon:yes stop_codon:yes gene_type:complete